MSNAFEPKTGMDDMIVDYDKVGPALLEMQAALYKQMALDNLVYGIKAGQGFGKGYRAAEKIREQVRANFPVPIINSLDNGRLGTGILKANPPTKLPQKVCNYRKPKVYWFGEAGNNVPYSLGNRSTHFTVMDGGMHPIIFKDYFEHVGDTVETFKGKRFIGISEPEENQLAEDFIKKITGDVWTETRTLDVSSKAWVPQGKLYIGGSKPLKINDKSKETIERVKQIEY